MKNITMMMAAALLVLLVNGALGDKHGYCPAVQLDQAGICVTDCNGDRDCPGTEKCCSNGCGKLCTKAVTSKPGDCPPIPTNPKDIICFKQRNPCQVDGDCDGPKKCCWNGCSPRCLAPASKPGDCPAIDEDNILCINQVNPCKTDIDCEGQEKCCWTGCSPVCMKPAPRKGVCPYSKPDPEIICDWFDECSEDTGCQWPKKCCEGLCGNICVMPEVPKAGLCPVVESGGFGICVEACHTDTDCEGTQKCCSNGCGHACSPPDTNTCEQNGKYYRVGENVPDPDGCNTCTCDASGGILCTEIGCTCEISGKMYGAGQWYPSYTRGDECNQCKCRGDNDNLGAECTDYYCGGGESKPVSYTNKPLENEPKPGQCPPEEENPICVKQLNPCKKDQDCEGSTKCCWNGCSPLCLEPEYESGKPEGMKAPVIAAISVGAAVVGIVVIIAILILFFMLNKKNGGQNDTKKAPVNAEEAGPLPTKN